MLAILMVLPALSATTVSAPKEGEWFGMAVAGPGDVDGDGYADALVGAPAQDAGSAYLYLGGPDGLDQTPDQALQSGGEEEADFGVAVAAAGDMDGDGLPDVAVGERSCAGAVTIYPGSSGGLDVDESVYLWGLDCLATIGNDAAGLGDIDGDGLDDLALGSEEADEDQGAVLLFYGSAARGWAEADRRLSGPSPGGHFGGALSGAGDIDGDGYADLLVGAREASGTGEAHLYLGGPDGPGGESDARMGGAEANASFGEAVAGLGDLDGDGYGDLAIGAPGGGDHYGITAIYLGDAQGLPVAATQLSGTASASGYGQSLAGPGDTDGDGYADLLVGAYQEARGRGEILLYRGAPGGLASETGRAIEGAEGTQDAFGFALAGAGDIDGDGLPDALATALGDVAGAGSLRVVLGGPDPVEDEPGEAGAPEDGGGGGGVKRSGGCATGGGAGGTLAVVLAGLLLRRRVEKRAAGRGGTNELEGGPSR